MDIFFRDANLIALINHPLSEAEVILSALVTLPVSGLTHSQFSVIRFVFISNADTNTVGCVSDDLIHRRESFSHLQSSGASATPLFRYASTSAATGEPEASSACLILMISPAVRLLIVKLKV